MTSKAASFVVLVSGLIVGARARAHAQSAPEPHDTVSDAEQQTDDENRGTAGARVEASTAAGTDAARRAELRASARHGSLDLSLAGRLDDRSDRAERGAAVAIGRDSGASHLQLTTALTDTALDLAIATVDIRTTHGGVGWSSGRYELGGIDHELVAGASYTATTGTTSDEDDDTDHMGVPLRERRADHRFLEAYLKDTLHVIETLDVSGGFVFDDWRNLSAIETIRYGTDEQMDLHAPSLEEMHISPQLGAVYRATDHVGLRAAGYHSLRAPTVGDLYVPLVVDGAVIAASTQLRPESVWAGEVGPELRLGSLEARAVGFWHEIDSPVASSAGQRTNLDHARMIGVTTEASWRPVRPVLATVAYTRSSSAIRDTALAGNELSLAPRHRGTALLTYDAPRIAMLSGGVRWIGRQYADAENTQRVGAATLVDAMAMRKIHRGLAGFLTVENLLDRRYIAAHDLPGTGRTVQIGLRLDSARF